MMIQIYETIKMFIFLAVELSVLFLGISMLVGIIQSYVPANKIEAMLRSDKGSSYFLAAFLGSITPFCSCSTIPMLKGLIRARAGFGPMMVFLFSSPLLNPVVVVLLIATFGIKLTAIYVIAALGVSLCAGWLLHQLGFQRYLLPLKQAFSTTSTKNETQCSETETNKPVNNCCAKTTSREEISTSCCNSAKTQNAECATTITDDSSCCSSPKNKSSDSSCCSSSQQTISTNSCCSGNTKVKSSNKAKVLWRSAWSDFVDVLPYLLIGIAIGSLIYGFIPTDLLGKYAGEDNPLAIPVAAIIGVPLYIRAEAVIPLAAALMTKGVGAGAVLALIIGSAGASLTELILLRSLFSFKLIATFVAVIFSMAIMAGYATYIFF